MPITNIPNNHLSFLLEQINFLLNMILKDPSSLIEMIIIFSLFGSVLTLCLLL